MIITKTPFRVSFVGGGSDLESFYKQYPGAVLCTTINKFMYITSHSFFDDDKVQVKYSQTETVTDVSALQHPIVKAVLQKFNITGAVEITSSADVPSGSGLGSSSSFTIGLLHNLYAKSGKYVTKEKLAEEACDIEINKLREPIGKQDQYAASFGGLNVLRFYPSGAVKVEPIHLKESTYNSLQRNLLMFYTGAQRRTSSILHEQNDNMQSKSKVETLKQMVDLVDDLRNALYQDNLPAFGELLHKNWMLKKQLASKISSSQIDELYEKGIKSGATGGKVVGAGGEGFMLFYCEPENQASLRTAMSPLRELKFKMENEGTKVIYVGDEYEDND